MSVLKGVVSKTLEYKLLTKLFADSSGFETDSFGMLHNLNFGPG